MTHHPVLVLVPPSSLTYFSSSGEYLGTVGTSGASKTLGLSGCCPRAACLAAASALQFPFVTESSPFWWPLQWITATSLGSHTASRSFKISAWFLIPFPSAVRSPLSLCKAPWTWKVAKAFHEFVKTLARWCQLNSYALIKAHNSALCVDHP